MSMATRVVVTLQDDIYQRVERLAQLTHRDVTELLAETITLSLPPWDMASESVSDMSELSDEEVLELSELQLPNKQDRRLSKLLQKQQDQVLSVQEHTELSVLMQCYQEGLLRKAQALHEAVRRQLRKPLEP
ncbi:MAG: hypothetical protein ETSY1_27555 [Candidatus Entotheonella factor]|uniref:Uncharacterized protein n=1 Tax=Entotheonella factor TaxID=1429438 RepID=W4LFT8_ENTF1|nr:hypothetical protein [Candidatus Entotheonella palauensis]ETW96206.1 MAG: hypothetical protein ETSY1_27555 [Candidatus Entotheonella factor]